MVGQAPRTVRGICLCRQWIHLLALPTGGGGGDKVVVERVTPMKRTEISSITIGIISILIATAILVPPGSLLAQTYYNPCHGDRQETVGPCYKWTDIICTSLGSPDGKCRIPKWSSSCYGWQVGDDPGAMCGGECYWRANVETYMHCETRTKWLSGTEVTADPSCPSEPTNPCQGECLNRQTVQNQQLAFPWYELFDCINPAG